jgi:phosphoribosylformylglycinamidine cyclo-ligase
MYTDGEYDLAGFCVGAVEKSRVIDGSDVKAGDALIGLPSSGPHSNGYSLVRKVLERTETPLSETMGSQTLGEMLLEPTKIYVKPVLATLNEVRINALAHITGGGIPGNLARVLPEDCHAVVDQDNWEWPAVFTWLMEQGNIPLDEMYRTFNCGIGMVLVVAKDQVSNVLVLLEKNGEAPVRLGYIAEGANEQRVVLV